MSRQIIQWEWNGNPKLVKPRICSVVCINLTIHSNKSVVIFVIKPIHSRQTETLCTTAPYAGHNSTHQTRIKFTIHTRVRFAYVHVYLHANIFTVHQYCYIEDMTYQRVAGTMCMYANVYNIVLHLYIRTSYLVVNSTCSSVFNQSRCRVSSSVSSTF